MPLDVCAAVIVRGGRLLLATRRAGAHLAGKWEFPGGKVHDGESLVACISREVHEELGLRLIEASELGHVRHDYPEKAIRLHFLCCSVSGDCEPVCREGQDAAWFTPQSVLGLDLAPADRAFIRMVCGETEAGWTPAPDSDVLQCLRELFCTPAS